MMKFIKFDGDTMLNIESIESLQPHYLGGTIIIGKSGERYTTGLSLEKILELIERLEASVK